MLLILRNRCLLEFKLGVLGIRDHPRLPAFMRGLRVLQGRLCKAVSAEVLGQHTLFGRQVPSDRMLACVVLACLLAGPAVAADDPAKPPHGLPQLLENHPTLRAVHDPTPDGFVHCEGFITGVVTALQNEQIRRARVCIPKGALYRTRKTHCAGETGKNLAWCLEPGSNRYAPFRKGGGF